MSTSSPTTTPVDGSTSTSLPTATSPQPNSNPASLYLFTLLATVLVLVLLSASLVLRSYVLRRRYSQGFHQAVTDGLFGDLDSNAFNGVGEFASLGAFRRSRRVGPKPVLWDAWIHPAGKEDTWSSITPVAVRCTPTLSPSIVSPPSSNGPLTSPRSHQSRPWPSFFSPLRFAHPLSAPTSPPPSRRPPTPIGSPALASARSLPAASASRGQSADAEKDAATVAVCVLVAMPDVSAPVYRLVADAKGKGVDPLESQPHQQSSAAGPSLPSPLQRSGSRIPDPAGDQEGLPLLEFGVVEKRTGEWVYGESGWEP